MIKLNKTNLIKFAKAKGACDSGLKLLKRVNPRKLNKTFDIFLLRGSINLSWLIGQLRYAKNNGVGDYVSYYEVCHFNGFKEKFESLKAKDLR